MTTRIRRILAASAVVFGLASAAAAQSAASQKGLVRDHTGSPLPGAVVTVQHPDKLAVRVALTDLRGEYAVAELERGVRYVVRVTHPQHREAKLRAAAGERVAVSLKAKRCAPDRKSAASAALHP